MVVQSFGNEQPDKSEPCEEDRSGDRGETHDTAERAVCHASEAGSIRLMWSTSSNS